MREFEPEAHREERRKAVLQGMIHANLDVAILTVKETPPSRPSPQPILPRQEMTVEEQGADIREIPEGDRLVLVEAMLPEDKAWALSAMGDPLRIKTMNALPEEDSPPPLSPCHPRRPLLLPRNLTFTDYAP
jgi:hypothetical protein